MKFRLFGKIIELTIRRPEQKLKPKVECSVLNPASIEYAQINHIPNRNKEYYCKEENQWI